MGQEEPVAQPVEGDFTFVFETGTDADPNVLFASKTTDLTQKVVAQYKKRFKDKPLEM